MIDINQQTFSFLSEGLAPGANPGPAPDIAAVLREVKEAVVAIAGRRLVRLVLFGSRARGDWEAGSDIDVAAVVAGLTRPEHTRILDAVCAVEARHSVPVSFVLFAADRFAELAGHERRIALDIEREGIPL
jgi:predicted nucleotidyltransferase